jgi:hypothetical protein
MTLANTGFIGFEKDAELGGLFAQFVSRSKRCRIAPVGGRGLPKFVFGKGVMQRSV